MIEDEPYGTINQNILLPQALSYKKLKHVSTTRNSKGHNSAMGQITTNNGKTIDHRNGIRSELNDEPYFPAPNGSPIKKRGKSPARVEHPDKPAALEMYHELNMMMNGSHRGSKETLDALHK